MADAVKRAEEKEKGPQTNNPLITGRRQAKHHLNRWNGLMKETATENKDNGVRHGRGCQQERNHKAKKVSA
eukprot:CAMPEP_0194779072 /NCGR_PEP_ID=MMETSP0323_2-20130528/70025_1 /TAXON_ID=2866 ORGANISM="Crypthecodinium cohnii, Strain Seligo" /NCGR_SAMPLE_ID=MMETSP0323_2 /ASSEMBLY_ACC=CAM_ASM_000346 /LENGTH=70 /DNA_ID=CAMNT_0039716549 /DNA_START=37 /DNA_END=249 /DNA_ORIENTATION=+